MSQFTPKFTLEIQDRSCSSLRSCGCRDRLRRARRWGRWCPRI